MTDEQFSFEQEELLNCTHPALAKVIRSMAYEKGHSSGCEEVLNYVKDYIFYFKEVNDILYRGGPQA